MKSNEEFIAGIYEKAAVYTEEKETKIIKVNPVAKASRIAAMFAVCLGLTGVLYLGLARSGANALQNMGENPDAGIALSSLIEEDTTALPQVRGIMTAETVTFTGTVESVDTEDKRIWVRLTFNEEAPEYTEGSIVCIRWEMLENISEEITAGAKITATGTLSFYEKEGSEHHGCAELILLSTDDFRIG